MVLLSGLSANTLRPDGSCWKNPGRDRIQVVTASERFEMSEIRTSAASSGIGEWWMIGASGAITLAVMHQAVETIGHQLIARIVPKPIVLFLLTVTLSLVPIGCKPKRVAVPAPAVNTEANTYVAEADTFSRNYHLYGWRKAEALYKKAFDLTKSDEIRKKLLLTRFLIFIRQRDEDIPYKGSDELVRELCAANAYQQNLCSIAQWYKSGTKAAPLRLSNLDGKREDPTLDGYLNLLLFDAIPRKDAFPESQAPQSPLFLYLNPGKLLEMDPGEFEKNYPEFAEAYEKMGDSLFQKKKYRAARVYFQKAIDLIPDYTHSIIGLGNIYFYALEDYGRALSYYENALEQDHSNPAALWGKAMSLHQLGRYQESNVVADTLLATPITRGQWIGDVPDGRYYQGQGNYIKAYNYHLMRNPERAREFVDVAKQSLPNFEGINLLSGILFYQARQLEPARKDFLNVIQRGNYNCNAQLHLGLIYRQIGNDDDSIASTVAEDEPGKKALTYLLGAAACMESTVQSIRTELNTLDSIDLEPKERFVLRGRLQKKLSDEHSSACSTIEMIIRELSKDGGETKSVYLNLLNEILTRLKTMDLRPNP